MHANTDDAPSNWVRRWSHLVPAGASVLDLACGSGRHMRWFAARDCQVTGVDRAPGVRDAVGGTGELLIADLEAGAWPLAGRRFDAVVVVNYLWRERLADAIACVADGGVLIYETFAAGNETVGKPSNPDFLLRPGELLQATAGLRVVAFEDGFEARFDPSGAVVRPCFVQRIIAVRERTGLRVPPRHELTAALPC